MNTHPRYRLLVVSNETVEAPKLHSLLRRRTALQPSRVVIVAPGMVDGRPLDTALDRLDEMGIQADGWSGDASPLLAIDDALRVFPADEIIVVTHQPGESSWLDQRLVERARASFDIPVTHLTVDVRTPQLV